MLFIAYFSVLSYTSYSVQKFLSIGALNSLEDDGASVRCINRTLKIKVKGDCPIGISLVLE